MKHLYLYIASLVVFFGCKPYLTTVPEDFISPETYYNNEEQVTSALMGVYDVLGSRGTYGKNLVIELAFSTDEGLPRDQSGTRPYSYNHNAAAAEVLECWQALYTGINRANLLLENLDRAPVSQPVKDRVRGETLFLRAYYHFVLVNYWGAIPLKLSSTQSAENVAISRTPAKLVYDQVISDMSLAVELVPEIGHLGYGGRISRTAVQGVLGRVCLYAAGFLDDPSLYVEARNWTEKVIGSRVHSLNPDFQQVFVNYMQDKYDVNESIWEVEFYGNGIGNNFQEYANFVSWFGVRNNDDGPEGYSYGQVITTENLYDAYDEQDVRRDWTISTYIYNGDRGVIRTDYNATFKYRYIAKFRRDYEQLTPKNKNFGPTNFPLLRYSDVLLMFAEADNEVNGGPTAAAYEAVNQVRRRAMKAAVEIPNESIDLMALDKTSFFKAIKQERYKELAFEGLRKLDLLRWGIFLQTMKDVGDYINANGPTWTSYGYPGRAIAASRYLGVDERHLHFPIPTLEISLNPGISDSDQNPGW